MLPRPDIRRVLMTTDTIGGVWTYAITLCRGLAAHGVQVVLATMGGPVQPHQREQISALGARVILCESRYKLEWMDDPWDDVGAAGSWLLALEHRYQPDIVHLNGYAHASLAWKAPVLVVAHSCVYSWWRAVKHAAPPESFTRYRSEVRAGLQCARLVVAPTTAMFGALVSHYGPPRVGRVIFNGADRFPGRDRPKEPHILCVGRLWDEAKNAAALAAVAPELSWPVRLAGDIQGPSGEPAVLPNVELLGRRTPSVLADDYRRASIYAMPARYEPFGLSILEAALAGCALVLGDLPSLREIWGEAALYVAPDDPAALKATLNALIADPEGRINLAFRARERAAELGTAPMAEAYLSAYAQILPSAARAVSPVPKPAVAFA